MKRINTFITALLLISSLWPTVTVAQAPPPSLPYHTVWGCLGVPGGKCGEAIPFAALGNQLFPFFTSNQRVSLKGNVSYYVNGNPGSTATCGPAGVSTCAAGNDTNNCLTPATACLTLQHALNLIIATVDFAQAYIGTVYLAHNAGTTNYAAACVYGPFIGTSTINVTGDSTNQGATVITDPVGGYGLQVKDGCTVTLTYVAFADNGTNNGAGHIIAGVGNYGHIDIGNVTLGPMTIGNMVTADYSSSISLIGPLTVSGGANSAIDVIGGGVIDFAAQTVTVSGTPAFTTAFAVLTNGGTMNVNGSNFSGSATGPKCFISGSLELAGFDPNVVFPGSSNCTANNLVQSVNVTSGTLAPGATAFTLSATQPASPVTGQNAVLWNITSAGSASQVNIGLQFNYLAGYTGSSVTQAVSFLNAAAGTAGSIGPGNISGNTGGSGNANGTTTGYNFGYYNRASNGAANFGQFGSAGVNKASAVNVGSAGLGLNGGAGGIQVGGWFTLGQTALPTASAAVVGDNGSNTNCSSAACPIALWQANGSTVASVNATGGMTATLTNASGNEIVCYNTSGGLMTYEAAVAGCVPSDPALKIAGPTLDPADALMKVAALVPGSGQFRPETGLSQDQQVWLYADQVCAMDKRLCVKDASGALNYDKVGALAYAFAAIKELKADNDNLRACQKSWKCRLFGAAP